MNRPSSSSAAAQFASSIMTNGEPEKEVSSTRRRVMANNHGEMERERKREREMYRRIDVFNGSVQ